MYLLGVYVTSLCLAFFISATALVLISTEVTVKQSDQNFRLYASLPAQTQQSSDEITKADIRSSLISRFFKKHNSDLAGSADIILSTALRFNLDYKTLCAVALIQKMPNSQSAIAQLGQNLKDDANDGLKIPDKAKSYLTQF